MKYLEKDLYKQIGNEKKYPLITNQDSHSEKLMVFMRNTIGLWGRKIQQITSKPSDVFLR